MVDSKNQVHEVLSRMKEAYGVRTNVELSDITGIPQPTISNWTNRGNIPFRYIYECAEKTGVEIGWLQTGILANASHVVPISHKINKNKSVYNEIMESGGQPLLQRLLLAYGFTMQKQLGELLGLSSGTISTWVRRNHFPGDVVVACALDTGVDLNWLATGKGAMRVGTTVSATSQIEHLELFARGIRKVGMVSFDHSLLPSPASTPAYVTLGKQAWIVDMDRTEIASGVLLLNVDGDIDIYSVQRRPGNQLTVRNVDCGIDFTCGIDDVKSEGRILLTLVENP